MPPSAKLISMKEVEKTIDEQQSSLVNIRDGISESVSEGVKEGIVDGLKRGVKDGLKDCFARGLIEVEQDDIKGVIIDIPQHILEGGVKEKAKEILEKSVEDYLQGIRQRLIERIKKKRKVLPKEEPDYVLDFIKKREREAVERMMLKLPKNQLFREIVSTVNSALEETLEEKYETWREEIQKEAGGF